MSETLRASMRVDSCETSSCFSTSNWPSLVNFDYFFVGATAIDPKTTHGTRRILKGDQHVVPRGVWGLSDVSRTRKRLRMGVRMECAEHRETLVVSSSKCSQHHFGVDLVNFAE